MLYALLLLIFFTVLPLAVRSEVVKRVLLLAVLFEVIKFLIFPTLGEFLMSLHSDTINFMVAVSIFLTMLPEMFIGHTHAETIPLQTKIVMAVCGIIWNMVPAYLISICLPVKRAADDLKKPISTISI